MEILYKKEKEEADLLLEQQRLVSVVSYELSWQMPDTVTSSDSWEQETAGGLLPVGCASPDHRLFWI